MRRRGRTTAGLVAGGVLLIILVGCGGAESGVRAFPPLTVTPQPHAVCYGPHRDGQRPGGPGPSAAELREDLALMSPWWSLLRVYGADPVAATLLDAIRDSGAGMKVVLGVWIAPADEADGASGNAAQVAEGIRLANAYPDVVVADCVGNETQVSWSAHRSDLDALIGYVREVRAGVTVPVTVADDFNFWNKPESRQLAPELDFILMHAHPMWNGLQVDEAIPWLEERLAEVAALHPDRPLVLAETGWATSVADHGEQAELIKGRPGESEQKLFFDRIRTWSRDTGRLVFWFEAFDENWKGGDDPAEVEKHWGVYRADRSPKAAVAP